MNSSTGLPDAVFATVHEMTERVEEEKQIQALNRELQITIQELKAANQELESFSYSVSHDLRVPLRAIDGFSKILEAEYRNTLDAEGHRLLSVIQDSTAKMTRLIDDLLGFSRIGRQELHLSERPVSLKALIEECWVNLASIRSERPYQFLCDDLPSLFIDPSLMRQAFQNLLSNAIKYSRNREDPIIAVRYEALPDYHRIHFTDNGEGFDMRFHQKLFSIFQRLHTDDEFEGTGVGLAIVRRVIHKHGGTIDGRSELKKGAVFTIDLPRNEISREKQHAK
jgi:two-component system sensor kinase